MDQGVEWTIEHRLRMLEEDPSSLIPRDISSLAEDVLEELKRLQEFEWMYKDLCK